MCSQYWSLGPIEFTCPNCGEIVTDTLQTHFMGHIGSYAHYYKLGDPIPELQGVSIVLDGRVDDFIGDCDKCGTGYDFAAEIVDGKVMRVWPYRDWRGAEVGHHVPEA